LTVRRRTWAIVAAALVVVAPPLAVSLLLWGHSWGAPDERARSGGCDAVWLGHAWVDGRRSDQDVRALVGRLRGSGVRDLFVHAGPVGDDGSLDAALHPRARWAVGALHAALPGLRVQAWLGQRVDPGRLDLDDSAARGRVVESARRALELGFDGIHYNFEPLPDGHSGLLNLLAATRELTRSRGATLSMSVHHIEPLPLSSHVDRVVIGHSKFWTAGYLTQVAERVDQIAIMSYDTGLPAESLYAGYVRRQTRLALDAVPPRIDLLMGLPAYHDGTWTHHPGAETVAAAVRGVRLAIGAESRLGFGVAIYADFSAIEADWRDYYAEWVRR
jgi:hypothetical protein